MGPKASCLLEIVKTVKKGGKMIIINPTLAILIQNKANYISTPSIKLINLVENTWFS